MKRVVMAMGIALSGMALAKGDAGTLAAAAKVIDAQYKTFDPDATPPAGLYATDALFAVTGKSVFGGPGETPPRDLGAALYFGLAMDRVIKNRTATLSADGQTMWTAFESTTHVLFENNAGEADFTFRTTEVLGKTPTGWVILGGAWSEALPNAKANAAAQKGALDKLDAVAATDTGDASVREAFMSLVTKGFDDAAAKRADLVTFGSGPGERTLTGKAIATAWKTAWVGKTTVDGPVRIGMAPSKTTAWVTANVRVAKTKGKSAYDMPFRVFVVFDKTATGWSVVQMHLAVPPVS